MTPPASPSDWTSESPELTAFALKDGPFDPSVPGWAERRAEAESAVARSAPLRTEIGEIRRLADDIETDLAHEPIHRLGAERRESVLAYARNPGRGLPRRASDDPQPSGGSGWHRFWSLLTRPAMGFSLAAATALSIALALWSPWSRRAAAPVGAPLVAAGQTAGLRSKTEASAASVPPAEADSGNPSGVVVTGSRLTAGDPDPRVVDPESPVPVRGGAAADLPTDAVARPGEPSRSPAVLPRGEVVRGEAQLQWGSPARAESPGRAKTGPGQSPVRSGARASGEPAPGPRTAAGGGAGPIAPAVPSAGARDSAVGAPVPTPARRESPPDGAGSARRPGETARALPSPLPQAAPRRAEARATQEFPFQSAATNPRSSFPLKPGDDSYPEVGRSLKEGRLPSPDTVRLEELLNHFSYDQPAPAGADALSAHVEVADSPWNPDQRLVKIGLQARTNAPSRRPPANLVALVGLRPGSAARLSWAQRSLQALVDRLDSRDSLALLVDGPRGRVILPPTSGADREGLARGVAALRPEGAPVGLDGLRKAYALAAQHNVSGGINRVLWILDGEFSAEPGTREALAGLIREQTEWGVLLSVLGLGSQEGPTVPGRPWMPTPAGGAYASATNPAEAREALQRQLQPAPKPVAEEVAVEVHFNPDRVDRWRLIGQESRDPAPDSVDPGDRPGVRLDSGESVTALYEIVPARPEGRSAEGGAAGSATRTAGSPGELLHLEVGYRPPESGSARDASAARPAREFRVSVPDAERSVDAATADYKFAAAVVGYGLLLRDSPFKGDLTWDKVQALAEEGQGPDREGYRREFLDLVRRARALHGGGGAVTPAGTVRPRP